MYRVSAVVGRMEPRRKGSGRAEWDLTSRHAKAYPCIPMADSPSAKLAGKVALVTGSGQGIGQAIAIRLAEEGADIVVDDRVIGESAQQTLEAIRQLGRRAVAVQGDLSNPADDRRVIGEGVAQLGKIDILVNNAGVEKRADFWDVTEQDFDFVVNINLRGT